MMEMDEWEDEEPTWTNQTETFFFPYIRKPILSVWATCFFFFNFLFPEIKVSEWSHSINYS